MMNAAVWTEYGKLEYKTVPRPVIGAKDVLVRVRAAGVCITDLHVYTGQFAYGAPPHILGHEIAGEIVEVGSHVEGLALGQRVTVETSIGCGKCAFCLTGRRHLCPSLEEIGFTPHSGGYAEYVRVPESNIILLPDAVSFEEAGIMESVVCPVGALMRNGVHFGETVAVFGVGAAGLAFIQGAKAMGAGAVIAVARDDARLERAKSFGADYVVNTKKESAVEAIRKYTGGMGADLVCEAAGVSQTIRDAVSAARRAGRVILYGIPADDDRTDFPVTDIIMKQLEIHGAVGEPAVWKPLLSLVADGRINLKAMITHTLPLSEINQAFDLLRDRNQNAIKVALIP